MEKPAETSQTSIFRQNANILKITILVLTTVLPFVLWSHSLVLLDKEFLLTGGLKNSGILLLSFLLIGIFVGIYPLFLPSTLEIFITAVITIPAYLTPLIIANTLNKVNLIVAPFLILFLFLFQISIRSGTKARINTAIGSILPTRLRKLFLGMSLITAILFSFATSQQLQKKDVTIPDSVFNKALSPVIGIFQNQLEKQLEQQLSNQFSEKAGVETQEEILNLLKEEFGETMTEGQLRQEMGLNEQNIPLDKVQIEEGGKIQTEDAFSDFKPKLKKRIEDALQANIKYIPYITGISIFFTLQFLAFPLSYICALFAGLVVVACKKTGFAKVEEIEVTAKRLRL
ncbi:MAG: hypothetical protein ACOC6Q_02860 [Patescibacteria group bacterium]